MKRTRITMMMGIVLGALAAGGVTPVLAQPDSAAPQKKLIFFGWNWPKPDFARTNFAAMQKRPFDGVVFQLNAGMNPMMRTPLPQATFDRDAADLAAAKFTTFSDNFIIMASGIEDGWSWFSDSDWAATEKNLKNFARVAKAGRCKGFFFDTEPYGLSVGPWNVGPWRFRKSIYGDKPYDEVAAQVRKRGTQFIEALQSELPDVKLLCTWLLEYIYREQVNYKIPYKENMDSAYNLLPPFLEGMLAGAKGKTEIIDGNEIGYIYTNDAEYAGTRERIRAARELLAPEYRELYDQRVKIAQSAYVDAVMNLANVPNYVGYFIPSQRDRLLLLEHNVYQTLKLTDEYAWLYSERMDWFKNRIPRGVEAATRSGKQKAQSGRPLGFSIESFEPAARKAYDERVYVIGKVTRKGGEGIVTALVEATGMVTTPVYDTEGRYVHPLPRNYSGRITPKLKNKPKAKFDPPYRDVARMQDDIEQNFVLISE